MTFEFRYEGCFVPKNQAGTTVAIGFFGIIMPNTFPTNLSWAVVPHT